MYKILKQINVMLLQFQQRCSKSPAHKYHVESPKRQKRTADGQPRRRIHDNENERARVIGASTNFARVKPEAA